MLPVVGVPLKIYAIAMFMATNNKEEVIHGRMGTGIPAGGSLRYRKGVPQQLWRCSRHAAAVLSNMGVGTADQWERGTVTQQPITRTYYICCPDVVGHSVFAVQAWAI